MNTTTVSNMEPGEPWEDTYRRRYRKAMADTATNFRSVLARCVPPMRDVIHKSPYHRMYP